MKVESNSQKGKKLMKIETKKKKKSKRINKEIIFDNLMQSDES